MKFLRNPKIRIWLTLGLSLFGLSVAGLSTFAWFQIETTKKTLNDGNTVKSADPNIQIQNDKVMGYKIEPPIGANGFRDYSVTNVINAAGSTIAVDNGHRAGEDTDFDIPPEGVGYYLVKKSTGGFKYQYDSNGDGTKENFYSKFSTMDGDADSTTTAYIDSVTLANSETIRIRHYDFVNNSTVHEAVNISGTISGITCTQDAVTNDITIGAAAGGKYRIWFDYTANSLTFEAYSVASKGVTVRSRGGSPTPKEAAGTVTKPAISIWHIDKADATHNVLHIWNIKYDDDYDTSDGYGNTGLETWFSSSGFNGNPGFPSTSGHYEIKRNNGNAGDYFIKGFYDSGYHYDNNGKHYLYLFPFWVKSFEFQIAANYDSSISKWSGNYSISTKQRKVTGWYDDGGGSGWWTGGPYDHSYSFATQTVTYVNGTFGGDLDTDTAYKWMKYKVNDDADTGSYSTDFDNWYSDPACSVLYTETANVTGDITIYGKFNTKSATLKAAFFIKLPGAADPTPTSFTPTNLGSVTVYNSDSGYTVPTSGYNDPIELPDSATGSYYKFVRSGTSWYTTSACTTTHSAGTDWEIFAKYVADLSDHTTFYVDVRKAYQNSDPVNSLWSGIQAIEATSDASLVSGYHVGLSIYRFTMPNSKVFRLANNGISYGHDRSYKINSNESNCIEGVDGHDNHVLFVYNSDNNAAHTMRWCAPLASVHGSASVEYWTGTKWDELVEMHIGNDKDRGNYFVYEYGAEVAVGTELRLTVTGSSIDGLNGSYYWGDYLSGAPFYVTSGATHTGVSIKTVGYVGNAKMNFYLTHDKKVSMAVVPDYGNGYYIMNSNRASWNDPEGAFKMSRYDTGLPANADAQYRAVIQFSANDTWKIRSDDWLDVIYESQSGTAIASNYLSVSTDGNNNLIVNSAGIYEIFFKLMKDGTKSAYIIKNDSLSPTPCSPDSTFTADTYYVVGNGALYTGVSNSTSANSGYFGGTKMASGNNMSASYLGYFARGGEQIFIRSYINAVDTLYKESASGSETLIGAGDTAVTLDTTTGVITFGSLAAGRYNIYVFNGKISVEAFQSSDFFRLNPIDTTKNNSYANINGQKTAVILEVPFVCDNPYASTMSLSILNAPTYASAFLYCSDEKLEDPYDTLHGKSSATSYYASTYLHLYSAGSLLPDANSTFETTPNSDKVYYAYIVIDYIPTGAGVTYDFADATMYFYLHSNQK